VASPVGQVGVAADESERLHAVDVTRHAGGAHALLRGQLRGGDPRLALDRDEERRLPCAHAEICDLAAELACKLEQHRPESTRNVNLIDRQHR
jgi:hypothetical protein